MKYVERWHGVDEKVSKFTYVQLSKISRDHKKKKF